MVWGSTTKPPLKLYPLSFLSKVANGSPILVAIDRINSSLNLERAKFLEESVPNELRTSLP